MDVLDDVLDTLDLKGVFYFRTHFCKPYGVTVPDLGQAARFHLVVQGQCRVEFACGNAADLGPGDLVLIPHGRSHALMDAPGRRTPPLETVLQDAGYDGKGVLSVGGADPNAATQLICGHFNFRDGADHPLLRALPDYLVITAAMRMEKPWLDEMLRLVARRVFSREIGSAAAVTRLSEVVFIEILRAAIDRNEALRTILEGFQDRHIGRALDLIHGRPENPWTVDGLASEIGMSRSRFAERFSTLIGTGPMAYLTDWRMQRALQLLDDSRCSIQQVAAQIGYRSPAAFSRAFASKFGHPPSEHRRIAL